MKPIVTTLLLLASACSPSPDGFLVEPELSDHFDRAAEEWCGKSGCCPYQSGDGDSRAVVSTRKTLDRLCPPLSNCVGIAVIGQWSTDIHVLDGLSERMTYAVLLHEIGHHCGCGHSESRDDVMFAVPKIDSVTVDDAECAR